MIEEFERPREEKALLVVQLIVLVDYDVQCLVLSCYLLRMMYWMS